MNKLEYWVVVVVLAVFAFTLGTLTKPQNFGGIPSNSPTIAVSQTTAGQVLCNTTSSLIVATNTARTSFRVADVGATLAYLCRNGLGACSATSGLPLYATSSGSGAIFEQNDGYTGPYTCSASTTVLVNYWQSN